MVRAINEDALLVRPDLGVFAVADGLGGGVAGDVASTLVVDSVREAFERPQAVTWPPGVEGPLSTTAADLLVTGLRRAQRRIVAVRRGLGAKKMGSTFAGITVSAEGVTIAHVGDSRVYRLRGPQLERLTEDHSIVNGLVLSGVLAPDRAMYSPFWGILARAIGIDQELEVDTRVEGALPGDVYLITSDGLHAVVQEDEVTAILLAHPDLATAARALVDRANAKGGPDNITAVLVRVLSSGHA